MCATSKEPCKIRCGLCGGGSQSILIASGNRPFHGFGFAKTARFRKSPYHGSRKLPISWLASRNRSFHGWLPKLPILWPASETAHFMAGFLKPPISWLASGNRPFHGWLPKPPISWLSSGNRSLIRELTH
mgnify:CR=1 FL=1